MSSKKEFVYKFTLESLDEYLQLSDACRMISQEVSSMITNDQLVASEETMIELAKLNVNSFIFTNYLEEIIINVDTDDDGYVKLFDGETKNIYKCVRSLLDSKVALLKSNISLEIH